MSYSTHISTLRSVAAAGALAAAALIAPAAAHAQATDGERALLNRIDNPAGAVTAIAVVSSSDGVFQDPVTGERALAVRIPNLPVAPAFGSAVPSTFAAPEINGTRALLGSVRMGR